MPTPVSPSSRTDAAQRTSSSPLDGLDDHLRATTRTGWLALIALVAVIVAVIGWTVFGQAPTVARGRGFIIPPEGLYDIGVDEEGTVTELLVDVGDEVSADQVVARLSTTEGKVVDVTSTVSGKVLQLLAKPGSFDLYGKPIATVEPFSDTLEVAAFIPAASGVSTTTGMQAFVSPASAPAAEYGSITGTVTAISPAPVDEDRVALVVGNNRALIGLLTESGPVFEVRIAMDRDASTPSGLAWSAGQGPDFAITAQTLAEVTVVIDNQRPVDRLLPG